MLYFFYPVCFIFRSHVKEIAWVKKKIEGAAKMFQSLTEKSMKNAIRSILHDLGRIHQVYHRRYVYALHLV